MTYVIRYHIIVALVPHPFSMHKLTGSCVCVCACVWCVCVCVSVVSVCVVSVCTCVCVCGVQKAWSGRARARQTFLLSFQKSVTPRLWISSCLCCSEDLD